MRGFGHEAIDDRWVELRASSSGTHSLVLQERDKVGWEATWSSDPWIAGTTGRPQIDRDAWESIATIVAQAFNMALGLVDEMGEPVPGSKPRSWSATSATPIRRDLGIALADLFLAIRRIGPRPAYSYGSGQTAYDAHRNAVIEYRGIASTTALDWASTLLGRLRSEAGVEQGTEGQRGTLAGRTGHPARAATATSDRHHRCDPAAMAGSPVAKNSPTMPTIDAFPLDWPPQRSATGTQPQSGSPSRRRQ